ncbi:hypothetical protein E6H36_05560 [Candidatus Bathyarchaeota archaeon]|nr:MAG: hypothetical protein E6H36_05560 [Candidatus Bathyarchaeota archaeon]TMI32636.1 MAG: hypothetical protein E6H29_01960 [Candidatus Bathyarchaeota archaeon]
MLFLRLARVSHMMKELLMIGLLFLSVLTVSVDAMTVQNATLSVGPSYLVVIMMENKGINQTYGSSCLGNCSYITQLANAYGLAESYSGLGHPSLQNYLDITSGGNYDYPPFTRDCYPQTIGCSVTAPNIVDEIEASGKKWKAYMEDYTGGGCTHHHDNDTQNAYENIHNPFVYYQNIYTSPARCSRIVNANPSLEGYLALPTALLSDLTTVSNASDLMWLSPNDCNSGHSTCSLTASNSTDCPSISVPKCVSQANQYLSLLVPKILNSIVFQTQSAALFIAWDEGTRDYPQDYVTAVWAGPLAQSNHKSSVFYTHYSFLHTLETLWNIASLTTYDASSALMTEFLRSSPVPGPAGGGGPCRIMNL